MIKTDAHRLVDSLPETATWDDLLYAIHVRKFIELGIQAVQDGRVKSQEEIERIFCQIPIKSVEDK